MVARIPDSLPVAKRELIIALRDYLIACDVPETSFSIGPTGPLDGEAADYALIFDADQVHKPDFDTLVVWPLADGVARLETRLSPGIRLLAMLMTTEWKAQAASLRSDTGPRDALAKLGVPAVEHYRNAIDETSNLRSIAPFRGGFGHFYADIRPPIDLVGWATTAVPVAVHLAVTLVEQKADIASKLANYLPEFED